MNGHPLFQEGWRLALRSLGEGGTELGLQDLFIFAGVRPLYPVRTLPGLDGEAWPPAIVSIDSLAKVLSGLLLHGKRKVSFPLSSQINDLHFWSLIRAPHQGRVDDFFRSHQL